jgi:O-antigen ligase
MRSAVVQHGPLLDNWLAAGAVALCGCGVVALFAGAGGAALPLVFAGGALLAVGLVIILAARWLDPLLLLVLALPLPALYSTDAIRIAPAALLNLLVVAAWLLAHPGDMRRAPTLPVRSTAVLLTAIVIAALFAQSLAAAAREVINWLLLVGVLFIAAHEIRSRDQVDRFARLIGMLAGICGALALLQMIGIIPGRFARGDFYRATLGFGWPNELAMFFALTLPFATYIAATARTTGARIAGNAIVAAAVLGLVATFSRGAWLAVLMSSLVLLFSGDGRFVVRVWVAALISGIVIDVLTGGAISARIASTIGDWVVEQRAALTLAGLMMFAAHPWTGVGPGGFASSLEEYGPNISWLWDYLPTAQNAYVQMAAETGLIGLTAFIVFLVTPCIALIRAARRTPALPDPARRTLLWASACALALGMVEWTFAHGIGQLIMLIAAMSMTTARRADT